MNSIASCLRKEARQCHEFAAGTIDDSVIYECEQTGGQMIKDACPSLAVIGTCTYPLRSEMIKLLFYAPADPERLAQDCKSARGQFSTP